MAKVIDLDKKLGKNLNEEGSDLKLLTPDGDELGITLKVKSVQSVESKRVLRKQAKLRAKKQARNIDITAEEIEKNDAELLKTVVVGGDKFAISGKEIDPTKMTLENALLIAKEYPFILSQVVEFCGDEANFYGQLVGN